MAFDISEFVYKLHTEHLEAGRNIMSLFATLEESNIKLGALLLKSLAKGYRKNGEQLAMYVMAELFNHCTCYKDVKIDPKHREVITFIPHERMKDRVLEYLVRPSFDPYSITKSLSYYLFYMDTNLEIFYDSRTYTDNLALHFINERYKIKLQQKNNYHVGYRLVIGEGESDETHRTIEEEVEELKILRQTILSPTNDTKIILGNTSHNLWKVGLEHIYTKSSMYEVSIFGDVESFTSIDLNCEWFMKSFSNVQTINTLHFYGINFPSLEEIVKIVRRFDVKYLKFYNFWGNTSDVIDITSLFKETSLVVFDVFNSNQIFTYELNEILSTSVRRVEVPLIFTHPLIQDHISSNPERDSYCTKTYEWGEMYMNFDKLRATHKAGCRVGIETSRKPV